MTMPYIGGLAGYRTARTTQPRIVFRDGKWETHPFPAGVIINGTLSRDPLNTGDIDVLRPGLLMGKVTATGLYASSILGVTTAAEAIGSTDITAAAATVTELVRRVGATGTFKLIGPPAANGVVAIETVTYSAASGTSITATAIVNAFVSGSLIVPTDGSETPITIIPDGNGIKVTDQDGTSENQPFALCPIGGVLLSSQIVNWPSDTSIREWIVGAMTQQGAGRFVFDHLYLA